MPPAEHKPMRPIDQDSVDSILVRLEYHDRPPQAFLYVLVGAGTTHLGRKLNAAAKAGRS